MRVTELLEILGFTDKRFFTEEAALRGTYVHEATALLDKGDLDLEKLDPSLVGYVRAWETFKAEKKPEILKIEHRIEIPESNISGTLDRLIRMDGKEFLVDLKTGGPEPWHRWQVALYSLLHQMKYGGAAPHQSVLYLDSEGRYKWLESQKPWHDRERAKSLIVAAQIAEEVKSRKS